MVGTGTTISQDSSVFTITADSEGGNGVAGDFTLTFKATDQIAVDNETLSFSLTFANIIDSSAGTILLIKAAGNNATNDAITYQNSSDVSTGFTETGTPQAGTFSPYRSGGYSFYAEDQNDELVVAADADFNFGSGDFTIEYWIYPQGTPNGAVGIPDMRPASTNGNYVLININTSNQLGLYVNASQRIAQSSSTALTQYEWNHVALVRSGSTTTLYIDGSSVGTWSDSTTYTQGRVVIHDHSYTAGRGYSNGVYIRDFRIVKGTAVYTSAFTPPTETLTAISGTSLLTCHAPYIADGSTSGHSITVSGTPHTQPFGPYDYEPWVGDTHGGSVYLDGSGDYMVWGSGTIGSISGDFTVEGWVYHEQTSQAYKCMTYFGQSGSNRNIYIGLDNSAAESLLIYADGDGELINGGAGSVPAFQWNHIALVRNGTTTTAYVNGVSKGTTSAYSGVTILSDTTWRGLGYSAQATPSQDWPGYIADFRVVNGTAVYTSAFTPPTAPLSHISNTKILMQNKSDANIYDAAGGNVITDTNATSNTTNRKFSTSSSIDFTGTGSYLEMTPGYDDPRYELGTEDWTIEMWHRKDTGASQTIWSLSRSGIGSGTNVPHFYNNLSGFYFYVNGADRIQSSSGITNGTWYHLAVTREGNAHKLFVNGTQEGSTWTDSLSYAQGRPVIGGYYSSLNTLGTSSLFNGQIQDFRITKGLARYTANFTAPTAEFEL